MTMTKQFVFSAALLVAASFPVQLAASTMDFNFSGPGISANIALTYGAATDSKYSQAYEVTGISGTFSDSNNGLNIVNAAIGSLVPINHATPESTNLLAPNDFSSYPVASGLAHGAISFDNLFWPTGSVQTATDYPIYGGVLDIYGLLFNIAGGDVVNIWSNGDLSGTATGRIDYGAAVVTPAAALDYAGGGVSLTPEPGEFALVGLGFGAIALWRRRATKSL